MSVPAQRTRVGSASVTMVMARSTLGHPSCGGRRRGPFGSASAAHPGCLGHRKAAVLLLDCGPGTGAGPAFTSSREPYRPVSPPRGRQGIHMWPDVRSGAIASDPNASRSGMSTGSVRNPAFDTESLPDPMNSGGAGGLPERRTRAGAWHWQFMNIGPGRHPCVMLRR